MNDSVSVLSARPSHYPVWYRRDEELFVDDQCCENCAYRACGCPMRINEKMPIYEQNPIEKMRKEDAVMRDYEPTWCIYWEGRWGSI